MLRVKNATHFLGLISNVLCVLSSQDEAGVFCRIFLSRRGREDMKMPCRIFTRFISWVSSAERRACIPDLVSAPISSFVAFSFKIEGYAVFS